MGYKIVFFDIDGTLVNDEKMVPEDTIRAIEELKQKGIEPVIATGRAPYFLKSLMQVLNIESFVTLNGGYVVYKGENIYKRVIAKSSLEALVKRAKEHGHTLVFEGEHGFYSNGENDESLIQSVNSLKVDLPGYDPDFWTKEDIYQVFLHCEADVEHLYDDLKQELKFIRWHKKAMDVLTANGSKAQGIEAMLEKLGIPKEEAVAFGDGLNDMEMLETVGLGIAMGNSHKELLPYADYVTAHVDEKGIRQGLIHAGLLDK